MATFSGRVRHLGSARLALDHVTLTDSGNYSVAVSIRNTTGAYADSYRSAFLQVAAPLATSSGQLVVNQDRHAVYNSVRRDWHVQLTCGMFTSPGQTPVDVLWKTPSSSSLSSSNYDNGYFELLLDNPVQGGNYSCRLNPSSPAAVCFHDDDPMMKEVKVTVDETKARLTMIEAQQSQLKTENADLTDKLQSTEAQHHTEIANLTQQVHSLETQQHTEIANLTQQVHSLETQHHTEIANLTQQVHSLETQHHTEIANLTQHVHSLESRLNQYHRENTNLTNVVHILQDKVSARVSFHASLSSHKQVNSGNPVIMDRVINNEGGSYSNTTGQFTVPRNGTYGLFASVETLKASPLAASVYIMIDDTRVCMTYSYTSGSNQGSSCHAVLHLVQGQRVWLQAYLDSYYWDVATVFSGFLLSAD